MQLMTAVEIVTRDTRENTDPKLTITEAIEMVRTEVTKDDLLGDCAYTDEAYVTVLNASDEDIRTAIDAAVQSSGFSARITPEN